MCHGGIATEVQDIERQIERHPGRYFRVSSLAEQAIGSFSSAKRGGRVVQPSSRTGQAVERLWRLTLLKVLLKVGPCLLPSPGEERHPTPIHRIHNGL